MNKLNTSTTKSLTSGGLLAKNSVFNLVGQGVPLLAAIIAIPLLIRGLGVDRFGVLTLAWMVIGYFSLFDLGLGRALTQLVSKKLGAGENEGIPVLVWTSLALMFGLGLIGALALSLATPWLVNSALKIPDPLTTESLSSFYLLAAGIPIVIVTTGLAGVLSALQRFDVLNKIRIPMGIYSFFAPLLVLPFSQSLYPITAVLVLGRLIACGIHISVCLRVMPIFRSGFDFQFSVVKPLFHFGAWMTVTNVVGPLMVYLDRFVIGGIVSISAVAYYATPYEMVTKLWIIPSAIVGVLYPAFAASYTRSVDSTIQLFIRGTKYIALALFPLVLLVSTFAHEGLQWWLGDEFAQKSTEVLQCLAIGVFVNSMAMVFIAYIQAIGKPDVSAKLHFVELPFYLLLLWWGISSYGIIGAAFAWVARVAVDGGVLFALGCRYLGGYSGELRRMSITIVASVCAICLPLLAEGLLSRSILFIVLMIIFLFVTWFEVFAIDERSYIIEKIRRLTISLHLKIGKE